MLADDVEISVHSVVRSTFGIVLRSYGLRFGFINAC